MKTTEKAQKIADYINFLAKKEDHLILSDLDYFPQKAEIATFENGVLKITGSEYTWKKTTMSFNYHPEIKDDELCDHDIYDDYGKEFVNKIWDKVNKYDECGCTFKEFLQIA